MVQLEKSDKWKIYDADKGNSYFFPFEHKETQWPNLEINHCYSFLRRITTVTSIQFYSASVYEVNLHEYDLLSEKSKHYMSCPCL